MNQKITISFFAFLLFLIVLPSTALAKADQANPAPSRQGIRELIQDKINALIQDKDQIRTQIRESSPTGNAYRNQHRYQKAEGVINRLIKGIENRYQNTLDHKTRIEARIAKIEELNKTATVKRDMTAAKAKLATFNTAEYLKDLAAFTAQKEKVLASDTPLKLTSELKSLAKELQSDIKSLRQILADTLRLIIKS